MNKQDIDEEPLLSIERCGCAPKCSSIRVSILRPQISEDGECFAILPGDKIDSFMMHMLKLKRATNGH